jgi:hypothetical protein
VSIVRELPGIRIVRPLGGDAHRERWLVRLEGERPRPAVLVRPLDAVGARMVRAEAVALDRTRGAGVVSLVDVVDDPMGAAVLRDHCVGPGLATLLAERERWDAGEVVAVLRPVVEAVARLHAAGVAHAELSAAAVVVAETGGVLVDLGHAELFAPGSPEAVLARLDAVARDRDAVRALAGDVLRRVAGSRARAAHVLADAIEEAPAAALVAALGDGLVDLAAAVPVARLDPPSHDPSAGQAQATRLVPVVRDEVTAEPEAEADSTVRSQRHAAVSARVSAGARALRARLDALPAARRRLVVAGGAAVTAGAVLLALPTAADAQGSQPAGELRPAAASPEVTEPAPAEHHETAIDAAIAGDDPVAAALALLERRAGCFAELSVLCLENVDQQGSSALTADRAAIQQLRDGDEADYATVEADATRLVERLGDSALVEVGPQTAPASLLLMRSEAGWRIRDWVASGID